MLFVIIGRGWSQNDDGSNTFFYLYNEDWYVFCSPVYFRSDDHTRMFGIKKFGDIASNWVDLSGGVQF